MRCITRKGGKRSAGQRGSQRSFGARLRYLQTGDHLAQFLAGGDVAEPDLAEVADVEQGQPLGEEFAADDALAKAGDDPEADAAGEFIEGCSDAAEVVAVDV